MSVASLPFTNGAGAEFTAARRSTEGPTMSSGSSWSGWRLVNAESFSNIPLVIPTATGLLVVTGLPLHGLAR